MPLSIDERLEFLVKSTESLHATAQEQAAEIGGLKEGITGLKESIIKQAENIAEQGKNIAEQGKNIALIDATMKKIAETMSDLAIAVLNHERRLGTLDGGGPTPSPQN